MSKLPPTEQSGKHDGLHQMSVGQLVSAMNSVDAEALDAVSNCLSQIESFVEQLIIR